MASYEADPDRHHEHDSVYNMTWDKFGKLARELAMKVWREYQPDIVVGIAKGGVIVGAALSSAMRRDFFPIKLSTRHNEQVIHEEPQWFVPPTDDVIGQRVLLVDDMTVRMRTLNIARDAILAHGAQEVRTATLMVHGFSQRPDWWVLETDALILVPWDVKVIEGDGWVVHPEFMEEIEEGGLTLPMDL